ncbi:TIGR02569 family protein [Tomitella biformata]|uniref:TIGR02569 family protein n=1 Tax=Tomitella biformata TaxID=630403 RepID=UPI000465BCDF|nr:TIGR02569 family protein [Tomitella biformata]
MSLVVEPPAHVRSTFGLRESVGVALDGTWDRGWRYDDVVLAPVADNARAAWSAKIRESLDVDGVRLARPVRSSDGRYVVSGWHAESFITGTPEPRYDEVVSVAVRLHAKTATLERPRFLAQSVTAPYSDVDVFTVADQSAWADDPLQAARGHGMLESVTEDSARSMALISQLAGLRRPVHTPDQVVHGDLFSTVLFAGAAAPGIVDFTPYWRPAPWAAAVVVVDAISWGGADAGLISRWSVLPEWPQMLLRALMFRLAVHALHKRSTPGVLPGLAYTAELVRTVL